jgi:threonine dehydrogenase-like Zn-dependent dehydrogenase
MRSLWLEGGRLELRDDRPEPVPGPEEALVAVRLAGVCATDLELLRGYAGFTGVPGHELVGTVVAAAGSPGWVGARVVAEINAACGECAACRAGLGRHCPARTVLGIVGRDGAFADRIAVPVASLHRVPDPVPDEAAVFCEPLAAALEVAEQVHLGPADRVLLVGAGRLGQLVARVLALAGCDVVAVARHARHRELLARVGVATCAPDEVEAGPPGRFDVVVEASGSPAGFALARRAVRPRGTIVLKSTYAGGRLELDASSIVVDELTIVGSRCGPFAPALRLLERGAVDVAPLVEARYPLEQGPAAFEHAARPAALKVLLQIGPAA